MGFTMNDDLSYQVGARLRSARERCGWSRLELARRAGFQRERPIIRWERGEAMPTAARIVALCVSLGISADWLLTGKAFQNGEA